MKCQHLFLAAFVLAAFGGPIHAEAPKGKVKVFILAGQSNMQGKGSIKQLEELVKSEPERYGHLKSGGKWIEREDAWIFFGDLGGRNKDRKGRLTVGYGHPADRIGPELGFGNVVGDAIDEPVLLLKTCWGGQSLGVDFRPPSAGKWDKPLNMDDDKMWKPGTVGWAYKQIFNEKHHCLDKLGEQFPELAGRDYEIAGLVWFQGWNDLIDAKRRAEYASNLACFLRDIRKDLGVPNLPIVIGVVGHNGDKPDVSGKEMRAAQTSVAESPEFKGSVVAVQTAPYWDPSVKYDGGYHYNGSARFFYSAGEAMGRAMLDLLKTAKK
jgi:alpha-galactosidase